MDKTQPETTPTTPPPTPTNATPSAVEAGAPANPAPASTETAMPAEKPAAKKFNFQISLTTKLLLLLMLIVLLAGQLILFMTFNKQVKQSQAVTQTTEVQSQSNRQLEQQLTAYEAQIKQLNKSFPTEPGLVEFVQVVDQHLSAFAEGNLQFDTNDPITAPNEAIPYLPVTITATATLAEFTQFQTYLAHSPYLFMPLDMKVALPEGASKPVKVILKGRLYVNPAI